MNRLWKIAAAIASLAAGVGCGALDLLDGPGPCGPPVNVNSLRWTDDGQSILYVAEDPAGDSGTIQMVSRDGVWRRQVADSGVHGTWSPDGKQLAYVQGVGSNRTLFVAGIDGSEPLALAKADGWSVLPTWSPDAKQIAVASYQAESRTDIYVVNTDAREAGAGSNLVRLTDAPGQDGFPSWSPDGKRIAFESERDEDFEIYTMNMDPGDPASPGPAGSGSAQTRLTTAPDIDSYPAWSPDATKIAFVSRRTSYEEIYVMDIDGGHQTQLTDLHGDLYGPPVWSPDGQRILFVAITDGEKDIYRIDADGRNEVQLTDAHGDDNFPEWSPDMKSIAFVAMRDGAPEVFVMDSDGSNQTRLTRNPALQRCRR